MPYQEWVLRTSSPILAAASAAGLSGRDAEITNSYAILTAKHKELEAMPEDVSQQSFQKLDKQFQESLQTFFGNTAYNPEKKDAAGWFQSVTDTLMSVPQGALNLLGSYGEGLSNIYRSARTADDLADFFTQENWDASWDGEKLFDADIEKEINATYSVEVRKIAKAMSTGATYGEVLSSLNNEAEFAAFERFTKGDEEFKLAMRDYNDARISWGRDFAHLFGLQPDVGVADQGIEGKIYTYVSGVADVFGDIAFDPLTYVAAPVKAVQAARYGLVSLTRAELAIKGAESLTRGQKAISGITGLGEKVGLGKRMNFGVDAAFELKGVRKAFDEVGPLIKKSTDTNLTSAQRNAARLEVQDKYSFFDSTTIDELAKSKVFDAESAKNFFKEADKVDAIMTGRVGELQRQLPRAKITTPARRTLRQATRAISGYTKNAEKFAPVADNAIEMLEQGESLYGTVDTFSPLAGDIKNLKGARDRWARSVERALIDQTITIGGKDTLEREARMGSAGTIYTLARTILPKYHAKMVESAFANAKDEATARRIITGLYDTIADSMGIPQTGIQRQQYNNVMKSFKSGEYSEMMSLGDPKVQALHGNSPTPGSINPSEINGQSHAIAEYHLARQATIPNLKDLTDIMDKNPVLQSVSNTVNNIWIQKGTDAWSALNLLPRLGMRSVLDENLFHYLTMPIVALPLAIKGYQASITRRILNSAPDAVSVQGKFIRKLKGDPSLKGTTGLNLEERSIGIVARVMRKFFVNLSDEDLKLAQGSLRKQHQFMEQQLAYGKIKGLLFGTRDAKYLAEHVRFRHSKEVENFSSGMNRGVNDGIPLDKQFDTSTENLNLNVASIQKDLGIKMTGEPILVRQNDASFQVNFLIQLNNRVDRNGEIGRLAVQYMDDPQAAVKAISNYFKNEGKGTFSRFERSALQSEDELARDAYLHVRSVFQDDAGTLNQKLLDKIRTTDAQGNLSINATGIGLDDLDEVADFLPKEVFGYRSTINSYKDIGSLLTALFDRGFQVADRQVATLTREPVFYGYYMHYRRGLDASQEAYTKKLIESGMSEKVAASTAAERYTFLGNELAMNRTLGFVDNPNVRSNIALGTRNLARYYRANEDFYRRAIRAAKPETIVKMRMSQEGLDHAGFIHEDENGEQYFFMPVDEITYAAYAPIIRMFTGKDPMQPMPMQLTGKIKMLTPSLDPESSLPTLSGPLVAMGWALTKPFVPMEWTNQTERVLFGPYAENRDLSDALTPSALKKVGLVAGATFGQDSAQVQSAAMKSIAYYAANGMAPDETAGIAEREIFLHNVQATARNVVAIRNLLGIFSPVAPGASQTKDVPDYLINEDVTSFKSEFNNLVEAEYAKGNENAYSDALAKWTRIHPGRLAYTVAETETDKVASIQKTKQAVDWMKNNKGMVDNHPQGSMWLTPQVPGYDISAYAFLKAEGIVKYKPLEDYFEQVATIKAENEYSAIKKRGQQAVQDANTPIQAAEAYAQAEVDRQNFLQGKPFLVTALESKGGAQLKLDALADLDNLLQSDYVDNNDSTVIILRKMMEQYHNTDGLLKAVPAQTEAATEYRRRLKEDALNHMARIAKGNANAMALYNDIFERLFS